MDKTLSLARPEGAEQDELLDAGRTRVSSLASSTRNKRAKAATTTKKAKGRKAKDTSSKGKASAEVEVPYGDADRKSKRGRHKLHDKDRKSNRGTEGADRTPRRSASELGIEWIESFCPDGQPHFFVGRNNFGGGVILICTKCKKSIWLPTVINEAARLDSMIDHLGATRGYCKYLDENRDAKMLVAKLQDLWRAKQRMKNNEDFVKLVISVMEDKEYDKA